MNSSKNSWKGRKLNTSGLDQLGQNAVNEADRILLGLFGYGIMSLIKNQVMRRLSLRGEKRRSSLYGGTGILPVQSDGQDARPTKDGIASGSRPRNDIFGPSY